MCHGLPRSHPCSHTSVTWNYCLGALIDLKTGYETPCPKTSFARLHPTPSKCSLRNCAFSDLNGRWTCCLCRQGPNEKGWCDARVVRYLQNSATQMTEMVEVTCGHGCCENCIESAATSNDDKGDAYKGESSRHSSRPPRRTPTSSSSSSKHKSKSHTSSYSRRHSEASEATGFPPVQEAEEYEWKQGERRGQVYAFQQGYGYGCGEEEMVWSETSPCSSQSEAGMSPGGEVVLDYSNKGTREERGKEGKR